MIGIYKSTNKLNNNSYIGKSIDIERRYQQHLYDDKWRPDTSGNDMAINKYGIENFTFEIIEECSEDQLNNRERYWIAYYDTYHNGYNRTVGGEGLSGEEHPRAILTEKDVWLIRDLYGKHVKRSDVFKMFENKGITERGLLKIWNCETWPNVHTDVYTPENKAWHKKQIGHSEDQVGLSSFNRAIKQDEIDAWMYDYNNGMSINAIAKKYNRDNGTVEKYMANPIANTKVKYRGRKVRNINTNQVFTSINSAAKWAKCGATTLTRHLATDKLAGIVPDTNEVAVWEEIF